MSQATFTGKKVALPGSSRYKPLPKWILDALGTSMPGEQRIKDPDRAKGLTVIEAKAKGFKTYELYSWSVPKDRGGKGIPELEGEILEAWYDYLLKDGQLLRIRAFSAEQLKRVKTVRADRADAFRRRRGLTDYDVMRRYPRIFAKRALKALNKTVKQISKLSNRELRPYRPTQLSDWRNEKKGCPLLPGGRIINHWSENGAILNDPKDIGSIVKKILSSEAKTAKQVWVLDGKPHLPTSIVQRPPYGISEQELTLYTKRPTRFLDGGVFHPHEKRIFAKVRTKGSGRQRAWPRNEVELFVVRRTVFREDQRAKLPAAVKVIKEMLKDGPIKPRDGIARLRQKGFSPSTFRRALHVAGVITDQIEGQYYWRLPNTPPVTLDLNRDKASSFLKDLVNGGAVRASEGMRLFQEAGFPSYLAYKVRKETGVLFKHFGRLGVWYKGGQDPSAIQDLSERFSSVANGEAETTDQPPGTSHQANGHAVGQLPETPSATLSPRTVLSALGCDFLDTLFDWKCFSAVGRTSVADIAQHLDANAGTFGRLAANLKKQGFVDSKEGRGGGCWLTEQGKTHVEDLRQQSQ